MDMLQNILDTSSHAIFTVDREGIVTHINRQAKDRFGLFNHSRHSHPAGRLQPGDMVILATSAMGLDDGNLTGEDLSYIGLHDARIRRGDMLIAVGVYAEEGVKPVYKHLRAGSGDTLHLSVTFQGVPITVRIENKEITVEVRGNSYSITYFLSIGQLVVLDRYTRRVKFWEEKGYSARKEGIGDLLRRGSFIGKSFDTEIIVVGYHFREFFEGEKFEKHLAEILSGEMPGFEDQEYEINGYALSASLLPITGDNGMAEGVIVKFRNIEDIRVTIMERNEAIRTAERQYREAQRAVFGEEALTGLFGSSTLMAEAKRCIRKFSRMDCPVLICGEAGTGRSRAAREIARSEKRLGEIIAVDCTSLSPGKLSAELASAVRRADGGTLVLDEVSRLSAEQQRRLLLLLQNGIWETDNGPFQADVRVLAITTADLKKELDLNRFRHDLYYRLSAFSVELPPLRSCREDIPFLVNELMDTFRQKYNAPEKMLSGEAFGMLMAYDWPGNVRELKNVLERAVALSDGDIIYTEHIHLEMAPIKQSLREQLRQTEKRILQQTLAQCSGDRKEAQELLGLSRSVFYSKLKEYGIH